MAQYRIATIDKKSVTEIEFWTKDDKTIKRITGWRWGAGWINTESGEILDIDPKNPDGVNVYDYDFELDSLDDGWYGDVEYSDNIDDEEREQLEELWDEESYSAWESEGWYNSETECWFYGPLEIEKTAEDEEQEEQEEVSETPKRSWPF